VTHPRAGASWEGFALEQVLRVAQPDQACFWATHQGAELDLLMFKGEHRVGAEFKRADAEKAVKFAPVQCPPNLVTRDRPSSCSQEGFGNVCR
jgi:hypothetical protein